MDRLVQLPKGIGDAFPCHLAGQVGRALQADADPEQAAYHAVEQFLAPLRLLGDRGPGKIRQILAPADVGGIPDHRQDQVAGGRRHRAQADLHREA